MTNSMYDSVSYCSCDNSHLEYEILFFSLPLFCWSVHLSSTMMTSLDFEWLLRQVVSIYITNVNLKGCNDAIIAFMSSEITLDLQLELDLNRFERCSSIINRQYISSSNAIFARQSPHSTYVIAK